MILSKSFWLSWGMLIISVLFNVYGAFIIKARLNVLGPLPLDSVAKLCGYIAMMLKSPAVVVGIIVFFLSPFAFAVALSRMEITVAYPVQIGLNFILLILFACLFLKEDLNFTKAIGMGLILAGVFLLQKATV